MDAIAEFLPFLIPIFLIQFGLMVWALIDVARREQVKGNNKVVWILVIVVFNIIGPLIYFIFGRGEGHEE